MAREIRADDVPTMQDRLIAMKTSPEDLLALKTEGKMRDVLEKKELDPTSRIAIYHDLLRKYSRLLYSSDVADQPNETVSSEEVDETESDALHKLNKRLLLNSIASTAKQTAAARQIIRVLEKESALGVNSSHELLVDGKPVQDSNMPDLLRYLVSNRKGAIIPPGLDALKPYLDRGMVLNKNVQFRRFTNASRKRRKVESENVL